MAQAAAATPVSETRVNTFLAQVYLLMFVGLAITGVVSLWVSTNLQFQYRLFTSPLLGWGLFIIQIIKCFLKNFSDLPGQLSGLVHKIPNSVQTIVFGFLGPILVRSSVLVIVLYPVLKQFNDFVFKRQF